VNLKIDYDMSEIRNLTRNGETFYPQTHVEGVLDPEGNYIGYYVEYSEYIEVKTDSENKILEGIKTDGTKHISGNLEIGGTINTTMSMIEYIENPEWIKIITDSENRILAGIKKDGSIDWSIGVPQPIKDYINTSLINKVDKEEGKSLIDSDYASSQSTIENPEFLSIELDANEKILGGRMTDGTKFENVGLNLGGGLIKGIDDPEGRVEIKTDSDDKIISYRKDDGTLVENVGIETNHLELSEEGQKAFEDKLKEDGLGKDIEKKYYLPKFGKVNIKNETFYLISDTRYSDDSGVVLIQMYDDTDANALNRQTLSFYYIKSTLTPTAGGGYDRTSVTENSVKLDLFPGKEITESSGHYYVKKITKVGGNFYLTSTLDKNGLGNYVVNGEYSVKVNVELPADEQQTLTNAVEVTPITAVPPYKAWPVSKKLEHFCIADINFGTYYNKNNVAISIKYQGSYSTRMRKRGFRLTFYKNSTYAKKDKIKIGEMLTLSGYNMKSFFQDSTRVKDPILNNLLIEIWNARGEDAYPWNKEKDVLPYNGATGLIKSFPIETWFGDEFYGIQSFGLKKDEKNFMLDGDDDSSGIYVSGAHDGTDTWTVANHTWFEDEMMDEMSQETADALDELMKYCKGFIEGTIIIDGQEVPFTNDMLEERIDLRSWIDYWIFTQTFLLWDNTFHNMIFHSRADKKMFYAFHYDMDNISLAYNGNLLDSEARDPRFWQKFTEEYRESFLNRYYDLRKTLLNIDNITAIYHAYIDNIPDSVVSADNARWGTGWPINGFDMFIDTLKQRLEYLDNNYFLI
jgi:hypothetical protein